MTLKNIFQRLYSNDISGKQIDQGMLVFIGNFLENTPVFPVKLDTVEQVSRMIPDSDNNFIFVDNGILNWCAYYNFSDTFPLGRLYFISEKNMFNWGTLNNFIESSGYKSSLITPQKFGEIIGENKSSERIEKYRAQKLKENKAYKGLVDGRISSTTISQGFYLKTKECIICGENKDKLVNCNLATEEDGLMIGYHLCNIHHTESLEYDSLMDYFCEKFNLPKLFKVKALSKDELIFNSIMILKNKMDCSIEKIKKNTITAYRKTSKFKIVLRLDEIDNYGYMIFNSNNKELARFDSANHHNVNYGPDHLHPNLKSKKVISSFLTGLPQIDYSSILKIVEKYELIQNTTHNNV